MTSLINIVYRVFVQEVLKEVDPEGVENRRQRRLKRRTYFSKVHELSLHACSIVVYFTIGPKLHMARRWI